MNGSYNPFLVVVSVLIAIFAFYTALDLANSVTVARGRARLAWLAGGALAMGTGIWSMHFVGMLAFRMPGIPIAYDVPLLVLSVVVAVVASALALFVISRPTVRVRSMIVAAIPMGAAIAGMHYIGIWSMRMPARIEWNRPLVAASIVIAVGASSAALWLAFRYRLDRSEHAKWMRLSGGVTGGIAIVGMHYTAMAAARFEPHAQHMAIRSEDVLATSGLAVAVTGTTLLVLAIAVAGSVVSRELARRKDLAEENERLYRTSQETAAELERTIEELQLRSEEAERVRAEAEGASRRLQTIQSITDAALAHLDPDQLLAELLGRLCRALSCDVVMLLLRSEDGSYLTVRAVQGLEEEIEGDLRIPVGAGIAGRIAATGEPLVVEDLSRMEVFSPVLRKRVRSLIGVPLVVEEQVIGVLHAGTKEPRAFSSADLELLRLVGERSAYALERARLYEAALEANRAKSAFLASMSHELRTPINAVMGYVELMEMGLSGPVTERQKAHLARIRTSNRHLLSLIEEILDLSKIEAGRMNVLREHAGLSHVASDALELVRPLADHKGIELTSTCDREGEVFYQGDSHRVRQILVNLLSNAIKFTDERGSVAVRCGSLTDPDPGASLPAGEEWAYVRIEDTGIGIPAEEIERIFQPFVQVDGELTRTRGGTGLGLTISRQFARLMGGDLTVRSEPGRGSCFTLWLPSSRGMLDRSGGIEQRSAHEGAHGDVGQVMQEAVPRILDAMNRRLRDDPLIPQAGGLSEAELEDHQATFLADIAQALIILEQTGGKPQLLRDGSDIQRLIAERHGAQRARLGWTEEVLGREFAILREEVERAIRASGGSTDEEQLERSLEVVSSLLRAAERISRSGLGAAG